MKKVAVILLSYRMPAMTDALVARIREVVKHPHDLFVIDNGSPESERAKSTTHWTEPNRRMTGGFNYGIEQARLKECFGKDTLPYEAFWFVCNDIRLVGGGDPLAACMAHVESGRLTGEPVGIIHPGMVRDPRAWNHSHMLSRPNDRSHDVPWVDIICPVYTRKMMEAIGFQFDPALIHGWGVDRYTCFEAWEHGLRVVVCDDVEVWHNMGTTYAAGKDTEFKDFDAYKAAAGGGQAVVLGAKYGQLASDRGFNGNYLAMFDAAPAEHFKRRYSR